MLISKNEIEKMDKRKRVNFINSISGYKSANLIATVSKEGVSNLAMISSVVHLGASPALLGFVIRPDSVPRDTLNNIRENKKCTLNHVNSQILKNAHQTSARYTSDQSEFKECNLSESYLGEFPAPYVKESNLSITLSFIREIPIEENGTHFIICEIEDVLLANEAIHKDGSIQLDILDSVCVSGLDTYSSGKKIGKLSYAKTDKAPQWID